MLFHLALTFLLSAVLHGQLFQPDIEDLSERDKQFIDSLRDVFTIRKPSPQNFGDDDSDQSFQQVSARCPLPAVPRCDSDYPYRSADGSCNNLRNPTWGQAGQPHQRHLAPHYGSSSEIRKSVTGRDLPSARKVTTTVLTLADDSDLSFKLTNMVWLWGQFLDHDLTFTPLTPKIDCCKKTHSDNEDCIPIQIPSGDPFYSRKRVTCMNVRRSQGVGPGQCGLKYRQQLNSLTSYIDASMVYGSSQSQADGLRSFRDGQLKLSGQGTLLVNHTEQCDIPRQDPDKKCFLAGEHRVSEWIGLTSMHVVFAREHNRIARTLAGIYRDQRSLSPREFDEKVYQEARRIVAAEIQVITYKEWLPLILGQRTMNQFGLSSNKHRYDDTVDATINNVFSTAAFRFGHSLISFGTQPRTKFNSESGRFLDLVNQFNQPSAYRKYGQDDIVRGVCSEPALDVNEKFSQQIRDRLFEKASDGVGMDLPALNIQRGRDHGIPSYNHWRAFCGLSKVKSLRNMPDHRTAVSQKFAEVYDHPDDIDLFPAGVTEIPMPGALVGPTFACLLATEFKKLKEGDRFWFENRDSYRNTFTDNQIRHLKEVTLARIICDNSDSSHLPNNVFGFNSGLVDCRSFPALDLNLWRQ